MTLGLTKDAEFKIVAIGEDEIQAIEKLSSLVEDNFNLH
jgi:phosphotransferase system HPr-like phosphotransfer protein